MKYFAQCFSRFFPCLLAATGGMAWLAGGESLTGPLLSLLLPVATAISPSRRAAFAAALIYYLTGSVSINGAISGYYGPGHAIPGFVVWIGASVALALPWTLGTTASGRFFALIATAVPPLGVIGWLSPLNAAGVMFPKGWGWFALALEIAFISGFPLVHEYWTQDVPFRQNGNIGAYFSILLTMTALWSTLNGAKALIDPHQPDPPAGWIGLQTHIVPARGNLNQDIDNKETLIDTARNNPATRAARVVVFPEAVLDDWYPGTRQQFSIAVPQYQTWLIGAQMRPPFVTPGTYSKPYNGVVSVKHGEAEAKPLTAAAGVLLGGNWRPWNAEGVQSAGLQFTFPLNGQRVWASLCVEQLQAWTWLLALKDRPTVILAMSNAWWAPQGSYAPRIQIASTKAWARLMDVPVVFASNH